MGSLASEITINMNTLASSHDVTALHQLGDWISTTQSSTEAIDLAPVRALSAVLDLDDFSLGTGDILPPVWHWLYFLPYAKQSSLGRDGHVVRGGLLPPMPLPRRMWAGGRLEWMKGNPLAVGAVIKRVSRIQSITHKAGRSGDLIFVPLLKFEWVS